MKLTLEEAKRRMERNNGSLDLSWTDYTELPDPLEVPGNLNLGNSNIQKLPTHLKVDGSINIEFSEIEDLDTDFLEIGRDLYASDTPIRHLPKHLIVRGACWLDHTNISEIPDNAVFGGSLIISNTNVSKLPDDLHFINGSLNISYTNISELPDPLTVKWSLIAKRSQLNKIPNSLIVGMEMDISYTAVTKLPDGFIVPGDLNLYNCPIKGLPERLIVGNKMNIQGTDISDILDFPESLIVNGYILANFYVNNKDVSMLEYGDYEEGRYLFTDGILTHVKRKKRIGTYDYYVGKIPGINVVSDGTYYAHCENIRDGIRDLEFKRAKDRGAKQYRGIDIDEPIPTDKMISMYRIITGACRQGTDAFLRSLGKMKDSYTVREAIELTNGQYGAVAFKKFFE